VYHPLEYARERHVEYLRRYARAGTETLLVGMNPGPFGMVQTGVPFGEVQLVRDWLGIEGPVGKPPREHPARPVLGFDCPRREVSGERLWGWARARFGTPDAFFARFFVWNYCPLAFLEESGRNRTPDRLPAAERAPLFAACDHALVRVVARLAPLRVVGIGAFATRRARAALAAAPGGGIPAGDRGPRIGTILHPSPASPAANRGWAQQAEAQLEQLGVAIDPSR
ncbi:MAG: single-stranded DNA-binding protein, partial [Candidatus Eiseniibacteriota bacterium]